MFDNKNIIYTYTNTLISLSKIELKSKIDKKIILSSCLKDISNKLLTHNVIPLYKHDF